MSLPRRTSDDLRELWPTWVVANGQDCWIWQRGRSEGYGIVMARSLDAKKPLRAHVVAYRLFIGPIPDGYHLHHTCETRLCTNPHHLIPLAPAEHRRRHHKWTPTCPRGHGPDHWRIIEGRGRYCRTCDSERKRRERATQRLRRPDPCGTVALAYLDVVRPKTGDA